MNRVTEEHKDWQNHRSPCRGQFYSRLKQVSKSSLFISERKARTSMVMWGCHRAKTLFQNKGDGSMCKDCGTYKGEIVCLNLKPRCFWDLGGNSTVQGK